VFARVTIDFEDTRHDYGEVRIITVGHLRGRLVVVGWTRVARPATSFPMRKANDREKKRLEERLRQG
jgi:uncharacterized DUF497 family protein